MRIGKQMFKTAMLLLTPAVGWGADSCLSAYPIPAAESSEFVSNWFREEGFSVSETGAGISAAKGGRRMTIGIRPQSPLGSLVDFCSPSGSPGDQATLRALRASLDGYILTLEEETAPGSARIPESVAPLKRSVTCLSASVNGVAVHFTGFVVDRRGFIVSTAHDLDDIRSVTVRGEGGEELPGEIVRRDPARDLVLIRVKRNFPEAVTLRGGRRRVDAGERIYMVRCSPRTDERVRGGTISRQQAIVSGRLLWQVKMAVSPGSSGSPVFDTEGRLIGIVKGRYRGTETRGFLIPLDTILEFLGEGQP